MRSGSDIQRELCKNIIIGGGTTLIQGFEQRLSNELNRLVPASFPKCKIIARDALNSAYGGAAIVGSLSTFQEKWISKDEYDEFGPGIVHRECKLH